MPDLVELGNLLDAVARSAFESENASIPLDLFEPYEVDEWAHLSQIATFLSVSDHTEMEGLELGLQTLIQFGLVVQDDDGESWQPTTLGWRAWQNRNDDVDSFVKYSAPYDGMKSPTL